MGAGGGRMDIIVTIRVIDCMYKYSRSISQRKSLRNDFVQVSKLQALSRYDNFLNV